MELIVAVIVAAVGPLAAFWLSSVNSRKIRKTDVAKIQLDNFYLPFMKLYIRNMMWEIRFSELAAGTRGDFMRLFIDNLHLMPYPLQHMLPDFYTTHIEVFKFYEGELKYKPSTERIDKLFHRFVQHMLLEYEELTTLLKLPTPPMLPLPNDSHTSKPQ